jgi:regulator of protease activity HflC (stomatin/prohibitin superfamily)
MTGFVEAVKQLLSILQWWVSVSPWEAGVRVRAGRHLKALSAGIHLRIPFLDQVFVQTVRMRVATIPTQTVTAADGRTITIGATVGYAIRDVERLYMTLHDAEDTIVNMAARAIADAVASAQPHEMSAAGVGAQATLRLELEQYGLADADIRVTDFALVRAYRLISDLRWQANDKPLETTTSR